MSRNPFTQTSEGLPIDRKAIIGANPKIVSAARWFWWIVALSIINTILLHSGSETSFVMGLGFTLVADALLLNIKAAAFAIDAFALGVFVVIGLFAVRGYRWAFILGGVLYTLDALIYLYFGDYIPLAFHVLALFYIVSGGIALHRAIQASIKNATMQPASETAFTAVAPQPPGVQDVDTPSV